MKKLSLLLGIGLLGPVVANASAVYRVVYFPIPYVAYHNLNATDMLVGLSENPEISLGMDGQSAAPLEVTNTTVTEKLTLNGTEVKVTGEDGAKVGEINTTSQAILKFNNLLLGDDNSPSFTNLNAEAMNVQELYLETREDKNKFPSCKVANPESSGKMHWVRLKTRANGLCKWYLSCGEVPAENQCGGDTSGGSAG